MVLGGLVDHREKPGMALDRAVDYGVAPVRWRTARLPLGGHVRLLKNAHLPCLAVCQLLLLARQLTPRGDQGVAALNDALDRGVASATKKVGGKGRRGRRRKDGEEEGGAELGREGGGWRVGGWSDEGCVERGHRVVSRVQVCAPAQIRGVVAAARCAER